MLIIFVHDQWLQAVPGQGWSKGDGKDEEGVSKCTWEEGGCYGKIVMSYNADKSLLWYMIIAFHKLRLVLFRAVVNL